MAASQNRIETELVLASASPRRRELLHAAGVAFEVIPADIPEERLASEGPLVFASRLAREKALAVATRLEPGPPRWVLGADTIVVLGDRVFGKPRDRDDALRLLGALAGQTHEVVTAVALARTGTGFVAETTVTSRVRLRPATTDELRAYVATGESDDKAGAYALQGEGRRFVESVEGSESNVIGLPVEETLRLLEQAAKATPPP